MAASKYIRAQAAKPVKVDEAPVDSVLNKTTPYENEMLALNAIDLATFNVVEVDRRIALLSRIILESALRDQAISRKDRADLALRAISTLEGVRARTELWVKDMDKPIPIDVVAYDSEKKEVEARLEKIAVSFKRLLDRKRADVVDTPSTSDILGDVDVDDVSPRGGPSSDQTPPTP